jgi:hypothetical protein
MIWLYYPTQIEVALTECVVFMMSCDWQYANFLIPKRHDMNPDLSFSIYLCLGGNAYIILVRNLNRSNHLGKTYSALYYDTKTHLKQTG